jgi:metallophosphoesterase (TIGR00282 family)
VESRRFGFARRPATAIRSNGKEQPGRAPSPESPNPEIPTLPRKTLPVRLLMIGDVVGKPGRQIITRALRGLRIEQQLDLVVANAENAAGGSGLTPAIYQELISAGVDGVTMGDHVYRRREIIPLLQTERRIVRPANFPHDAPGRSFAILHTRSQTHVAIFTCLGRVFMGPVDCPFGAADRVLASLPSDIQVILMDFHAEATSDMQLMGRHLDGRVTAVLGTHTHVPTADEEILPGGTAFQCDVGMTGPHESIIGRRIDRVLETTRTFRPTHFEVATGDVRMHGTVVDVDPKTGRAVAVRRLRIDQREADHLATVANRQKVQDEMARAKP